MLHVRVLGELELRLEGVPLEPPTSRRARSLLALLALEHRPHARAQLAARFWPDVLDESARTSLRGALAAVRRALGAEADRYLVATRERAALSDDVTTDAAEFERLLAADRLDDAIALWRGDLLFGLHDDWVLVARDEWRDKAVGVLAALAARAEAGGDLAAATAHARRMVALDPLAEEGQRTLIAVLAAGGDRAAALATYNRYADRLRAELGVAPSQATRALVAELREAEAPQQPAPAAGVAPPSAGTVTLLFTDLVGSSEILDALGDEGAEQLRRTHFAILRDVALSHAGREVKNLGDGLMVAFASSLDAAGCAVGIQQAIERHNRREATRPMSVRVGLHVGEPIRDDDDYFGTPVVVAKRLCDRAEGGQILASDVVRALVGTRGGFRFSPVGELALKGFSTLVPASELQWEATGRQRVPLPAELAQERGALVGREEEMRVLEAAWGRAREGEPGVVLVAGEPGIGKTRLVAELCRRAHTDGTTILLGRSTEEALTPYQPFVEALRHYVSACPADELLLQVGTRRPLLARLVPELQSGADRAAEADPRGEGEADRYALFDAVASFLREAADSRPAILVLDDLQWADAPSLLLLRHLARSIGDAPLLVLGTYRELEVHEGDALAAAIAELRRARVVERLPLEGLAPDAVAELIRGRGVELGPDAVRAVTERTEGNPFFVEEVVRQPEGGLRDGVPDSVKDLLLRRMRQLDELHRAALAAAAVLGVEFELAALERVTGVDEDALLEAMDDAVAEGVLVESPDAIGRYAFAHALIRETVYDQLSATRRARLHLRAAEALEALHADRLDDFAAVLAHHFGEARDDRRGFEYRIRAARVAAGVYASAQALAHYDAAIALAREGDERLGVLRFERGWQRHAGGDVEGAAADFGAALEAARAAHDRPLTAQALDEMAYAEKTFDVRGAEQHHREALTLAAELDDVPLQVRILNRLSLLASNQLDLAGAVQLGDRAMRLARDRGGDAERALAIDALKLAALGLGELEHLEELTAELAELDRRNGDLWYLQWTLLESAFAPLGRAEWDLAASRLDEATAIGRRVADPLARPLIHDATCWLQRSRGDLAAALASGRRGVELTAPEGPGPWGAWTRATLGWALLDLRAVPEAIALLEQGTADAELLADRYRTAGHLAWARVLGGNEPAALQAAGEAERVLDAVELPPDGAFLFGFGATVALARAWMALGRRERAVAELRALRSAAQRTGWREAEASAALVLGLAGDDAALAHAAGLASEHGLPGVEWEARAALGQREQSDAIVARVAASVGDERLAAGFVRAAHG
jgi:class 3 adenylate cyclase